MLNQNTINVLSAMNSITNSAILKYPTSILNNSAGDVVVSLNMETLDADEFPEIGIYNLSEFISTFKLFDEYECNITDNVINITSDDSAIQYLTTNTNVLENFNKKEDLFTSTENVTTVSSFTLTNDDMKRIKQASGVFKDLSDIIIESKDGDINVKLGSTNNFNAKSNSFSIKKSGINSAKEFVVKIPAENFNTLPASEYNFEVKYNEQRDAYRLLVKSAEIDMKVLMAIKK
jgi:hypothetical protein